MEVEIGTAGKLEKVEEDHSIETKGLSGHFVEDEGYDQEGIANGIEDEGRTEKQEDFKVARPPKFGDFFEEASH